MLKTTLIAAALLTASATIASAQDWRAESYGSNGWSAPQGGYGYDNGSSALGRYCPPGQYPHSWPSGWRCQYANGDFSGAGNW